MELRNVFSIFLLWNFVFANDFSACEDITKDKTDKIEQVVEEIKERNNAPGVAVGIVKDGKLIYEKGFGYRDIKTKAPVTPKTLFCIGSVTKSFTSFALGTFVDKGKLSWNDKVIRHVPNFQLKDLYLREKINVADILSHRTGFSRHDITWITKKYFSDDDLFRVLANMDASSELREKWIYQNHMYMLAGKILSQLSGKTVSETYRDIIFDPLEMKDTTTSLAEVKASDFSFPYKVTEEDVEEIPFFDFSETVVPCGGIYSNISDMGKWMSMLTKDNKSLIEDSTWSEITSSKIPIGGKISQNLELNGYGFGWALGRFHTHNLIAHDGDVDGFSTACVLIPSKKLGVIVLTNTESSVAHEIMHNVVSIMLLDEQVKPYPKRKIERISPQKTSFKNAPMTHELSSYTGKFESDLYGKITIQEKDNSLVGMFDDKSFKLKHRCYNVFDLVLDECFDECLDHHFATLWFCINAKGNIDKLQLGESLLLINSTPAIFNKKAKKSSEDYTSLFGDYLSSKGDEKITIKQIEGSLYAVQRGYRMELVSTEQKNVFDLFIGGQNVATMQFFFDENNKVKEMVVNMQGDVSKWIFSKPLPSDD